MKLLQATALAALLATGSTLVMAQAQNPTGDPRPLPPGSGGDSQSVPDQKSAPTNPARAAPPAATGSDSRPMGPPGNETPVPGATKDTKDQKKSPN
jgi:hypothetical protein